MINEEHIADPIPSWAAGRTKDMTRFGAALSTRDGRKTGNATVTRVESTLEGIRIWLVTDAGNLLKRLTYFEVKALFHEPVYYSNWDQFLPAVKARWNDQIVEESFNEIMEEKNTNVQPDAMWSFPDGGDGEVRVMGQDGKPHWMPLTEIVEYMQTNTPKPLIDEINEKIHKVVEDNGPVDKGQHIGVPPVPAEIYWCPINQNFYDYSGSGMGDEFYRTWLSRTNEFPLWDANDDGA